jgi:hypothetical protein
MNNTLMARARLQIHTIVIALFLFVISSSVSAVTVQIPNVGAGDSANALPLSTPSGPTRYQQIYAASAFSRGGVIDQIRFRNDELYGLPYGPTSVSLQVSLAYAATTVQTASPVFANNIGNNLTVVLDGFVTLSNSGASSQTFDAVLDVSNTFSYDPSRGDLLVQILAREFNAFTFFDASSAAQQHVTTRIWSQFRNIDALAGEVGPGFSDHSNYGAVTEFVFVPESPSIVSLLIGSGCIYALALVKSKLGSDSR